MENQKCAMEDLGLISMFNIFNKKRVLITGNTGFKGSWLTAWLKKLDADIYGISDTSSPSSPSLFKEAKLENEISYYEIDLREYNQINSVIQKINPDFIFHFAAQAIVSESYLEPLKTLTTNIIGTSNILEYLRNINHKCATVIITSYKCYEKKEWVWGYREIDRLGGKDIYSASKASAEIIFKSYFESFLSKKENINVASARAGNVIGGGDWSKDRIVVDAFQSWNRNETLKIRSPNSTRPWQHVLEPLSGYLTLAANLYNSKEFNGNSFNFGPKSSELRTVLDLIKDLSEHWNIESPKEKFEIFDVNNFHEAGLLKLNCDKALFNLGWEANLEYSECIKFVGEWYFDYYQKDADAFDLVNFQIDKYIETAKARKKVWAS